MDLQLSAEHLRFRNQLRAWLAAHLPRPWREELRDPRATETSLIELRRAWQKKLYQAGYLGMDWPEGWGGRGGTEVEKSIMEAELARADAPPILNILGIGLLGPALIHHGSEAQRRRFIPPMLSGDEIWCQGFSEPGAGSDLAALKTTARLDGDHFVLNGQKVWTTFGPWADWIFVLARTDTKDRYGGISFLLVKLDTPGVSVRPLRQITGESEFGEVFFDTSDADAALACAAAKAYAGDASRLVCGEAIQMHGGIGFTWELDLHFYFKRAKTLEQHYGSTESQLERALAAAGY